MREIGDPAWLGEVVESRCIVYETEDWGFRFWKRSRDFVVPPR
jgi:hypothetical protein